MIASKKKTSAAFTAIALAAVMLFGFAGMPAAAKAAVNNKNSGWIYFIKSSDHSLFRSHSDGSLKSPVSNVKTINFAVSGDWIFYADYKSKDIYKINVKGTEKAKISDFKGMIAGIYGNYLFFNYASKKDNIGDAYSYIYRMTTDGKGLKKLCNDPAYDAGCTVSNGYIYYRSRDFSRNIARIRTDGTGRVKLTSKLNTSNRDGRNFVICGNKLYYISDVKADGSGSIYRINLNGSGKIRTKIKGAVDIAAVDGIVYYETSDKVYKINSSGTGKTAIDPSSWTATRTFGWKTYFGFNQ